MILSLVAFLMPLQSATPAAPPAACPAPVALPAELAGWKERRALEPGAVLLPGRGADVRLRPIAEVHFLVPPAKAPPAGTYAGQFSFHVDKPGTIRVALGNGGWIDVVRDGKALESTGHGHGPECSNIHKIVDFAVTPGNYLLAISNSADAQVGVLVTVVQ